MAVDFSNIFWRHVLDCIRKRLKVSKMLQKGALTSKSHFVVFYHSPCSSIHFNYLLNHVDYSLSFIGNKTRKPINVRLWLCGPLNVTVIGCWIRFHVLIHLLDVSNRKSIRYFTWQKSRQTIRTHSNQNKKYLKTNKYEDHFSMSSHSNPTWQRNQQPYMSAKAAVSYKFIRIGSTIYELSFCP